MNTAPRNFSSTVAAISANNGASATISLLIPVKASMYGEMGHSGLTSELHSSSSTPFCTRTMPTSVIRWWAGLPPVVSKSTNTRLSAASIEREQGVVKIRPPIAEHTPGVPVAAHFVQIEAGGENGFAFAIGLSELFTRGGRDEG